MPKASETDPSPPEGGIAAYDCTFPHSISFYQVLFNKTKRTGKNLIGKETLEICSAEKVIREVTEVSEHRSPSAPPPCPASHIEMLLWKWFQKQAASLLLNQQSRKKISKTETSLTVFQHAERTNLFLSVPSSSQNTYLTTECVFPRRHIHTP